MFLSEQVGDSENVRENFKKIKFYLEAVTASGSGEVIFFTSVDSLVLDWTLTRKDLFGDFPSTEIWIDFNGVYYKDDVPGVMDAPPPSLTTITFDFLGNTGAQGTGFLIIGNGGDTSTLSSVAWGTLTGTISAQTDLQTALNLKLNTSDYNQHFVGKYTTLAALQAAYPTANAGDYGQVDAGSGHDVVNYNYDLEDGWIEGGSGSGATNTDGLPEGSTNLYFTASRVLAAAAFGTIAGTYAQGNDSRILDGETAFTWGNHASAGYLTSAASLAWAKITGTPTTLSGYGITDAYPLTGNPSGFLTSVPAQSFSSLTGKPTTISGYGITDAGTIANGGTGLTSFATGDMLYASAANVLSRLSAGTNGYVLTLASGLPVWAAASSLPSQTGNAGLYLTTNGTTASWSGTPFWSASGSNIYYNTGNVGIGTSSPTYNLHVVGALYASGTSGVAYWINNGSAIRGLGTGATNIYIDGNTTTTGTINFRASYLAFSGTWNHAGTLNTRIITATGLTITATGPSSPAYIKLYDTSTTEFWSFENYRNAPAGSLEINNSQSPVAPAGLTISPRRTIGVGIYSPNVSALMDLTSTVLGFLTPRMTTTQKTAISSPAEGLEVYDLTLHQKSYYNGTSWINI